MRLRVRLTATVTLEVKIMYTRTSRLGTAYKQVLVSGSPVIYAKSFPKGGGYWADAAGHIVTGGGDGSAYSVHHS